MFPWVVFRNMGGLQILEYLGASVDLFEAVSRAQHLEIWQ
jgi:hypothetical protein